MSSSRSASHVRPGFAGRTWRGFRRWRRTRPFWGGLFVTVSGVEIFLTTQMSLNGLSFQLGPTGFLSWLIPAILVTCGLLAWATPAQRMFYAVVAAVTALFSMIGVNLGGFFVGLILGIIGSGLVFAWTPGVAAAAPAVPTQPDPEDAADDTAEVPIGSSEGLVPGFADPDDDRPPHARQADSGHAPAHDPPRTASMFDAVPERSGSVSGVVVPGSSASVSGVVPGSSASVFDAVPERSGSVSGVVPGSSASVSDAVPDWPGSVSGVVPEHQAGESARSADAAPDRAEAGDPAVSGDEPVADDGPGTLPRRESPRFYTVIAFLLVLGVSSVVAVRAATPAYAAPCPKPPTSTAPKPESGTTTPPTAPSPTPTPVPAQAQAEAEEGPGIIGGIIDGITGIFDGDDDEKKDSAPAAAPTPTTTPTPTPSATTKPPATSKPKPADCAGSPTGQAGKDDEATVPLLDPDPDVPDVNSKPSVLSGTKLTMWGLRLDGIYTVHTAAGDVRSLKFSMTRSLVEAFALRIPQGGGAPLLIKSNTLTVRGDVAFYTTRFVGWLGPIKLTLTPDSPLPPDGIPLSIPRIDFKDPRIDLMYVSCDELLAPTLDESFVAATT